MHHHYPQMMQVKKINLVPRRQVDYLNNLRLLADTFAALKWTHVVFDVPNF